ncbi:MAG: hypothetical protein GY841_07235 [FCB group bacterium]|nr:hypothetical protein [FCB group bacterium]
MKTNVPETIKVDDVEYIRSDLSRKAKQCNGLEYFIVRTYSAGVFAGYLKSRIGKEVVVLQARRLWRWAGAASLSQLAMEGVSKPAECKFPTEVDEVLLTEAIEIIPCTEAARISIKGVPIWAE